MEIENFKNSLKRLKKCDMHWDEMKPNETGRLCQKCDKTIIDFSNMSFTEIAFKMSEINESICGLYLPQQLVEIKRFKSNIPLSIGLTTLIATTTLANSEKKDFGKHVTLNDFQNKRKYKHDINQNIVVNDTILICGRIQYYDTISKKNLTDSFANVFIKGTKIAVGVNEHGFFKLKYLPNAENQKIQLILNAVGFEPQIIEIIFDGKKDVDLGLILLKESELISYYVTKKRNFFGRLIRKITKPFRHKK